MMLEIIVDGIKVPAKEGAKLIDCMPDGHKPDSPCGGAGKCGKCRVKVSGELTPVTVEENKLITKEDLAGGIRLACMAQITGPCVVETFRHESTEIRIEGVMPEFTISPRYKKLGAAVDVGTTTIAALLYDGTSPVAKASAENSEKVYGADVISRIGKSIEGKGAEIAAAVRKDIAGLLKAMAKDAGRPVTDIEEVVITGNTAMLYLLTNTDPTCLSAAPFIATELFGKELPGSALNLPCPEARIYLPRCISSFVGADITTAIMASSIHQSASTQLLVDIGTNGEMALAKGGKLLCCSTAAGPAFEGAGITMGMMGKPGAVDKISVDSGEISAHVIGEKEPAGICGSGIIDAVAAAMKLEALDENGFLESDDEYEDETCLKIAGPVVITQKDIRMVQLAKSAIHAGALTLISESGVSEDEIDEFKIAGGFGSFINTENAAEIGLIPKSLLRCTKVLGNAALSGSVMLLLNPALRREAEELAEKAETVDLSTNPTFMDLYVESMMF